MFLVSNAQIQSAPKIIIIRARHVCRAFSCLFVFFCLFWCVCVRACVRACVRVCVCVVCFLLFVVVVVVVAVVVLGTGISLTYV